MLNTLPAANTDAVSASRSVFIPKVRDGELFIAGKSRLSGGAGRGETQLRLRINDNVVGRMGSHTCGSATMGCVSGRTMSTIYLAT